MFGQVVSELRLRQGLTQEELAGRSGLSVRGIRTLESGRVRRPRPATVRLLANAFGLADAARDEFVWAAVAGCEARPAKDVAGRHLAQLPMDPAGFVGRRAELAQLDAVLADLGDRAAAVVISAVWGTAGVGKTALAVHWAHSVADRFSDGQLYVNLRGFDPTGPVMPPSEAIRGFLDALEIPAQQIPVSLSAQAALYRSLLAGRRVLVLLDNARDAEQVRSLLPGSSGCVVVVTSRNRLTGLVAAEGAHPISLDRLSRAEARDLLAARLGADRVAAEAGAVDEIISRCAGLPLALTVVAARAVTRPGFRLAALAAELGDAHASLDAFAGDDARTDVRVVFSWSYNALGTGAARLFRSLGLHPGPDISVPAAAALVGVTAGRVRPLLAELAAAHLIAELKTGRYALHDLLRAYAVELAGSHHSTAARRVTRQRMLDHYLLTAHAASMLLAPHRDPVTLTPTRRGAVPEPLANHEQALAWFGAEHPVLLGVIHQAADRGFDAHSWRLAWSLEIFLSRQGYWHDWVAVQRRAVEAANRLGDRPAQAEMHRLLALAHNSLRNHDDAHLHLRHALDLFEALGDRAGAARVLMDTGWVLESQNRPREALGYCERALGMFRAAGDRVGEASSLNGLGWCHAELGDYRQAVAYCRESLDINRAIGNRRAAAATWDSLGYAHHRLGEYHQAARCFRQGVDLYLELGVRYWMADTLVHLGDTHAAAGEPDAARDSWERALAIFDEIDHPDAEQVRHKLSRAGDRR